MNKEFPWTEEMVKAACQSLMYKYKFKEQEWTNVDTELSRFKEKKESKSTPLPEWEIEEFYHNEFGVMGKDTEGYFSYMKNDGWLWRTELHVALKYPVMKIHSVKRLKDGEVFTVSDKTDYGIIEGFDISKNKIMVSYNSCFVDLRSIEKVKEKPAVKPPLGVIPEWLHKEKRFDDLLAAINRYDKGNDVPAEWWEEIGNLALWIGQRKKKITAK